MVGVVIMVHHCNWQMPWLLHDGGVPLYGVCPQSAESVAVPILWRAYAMRYTNALVRTWPRGEGPGCVGRLKEIWAKFIQEVARIPVWEHLAMWQTKDGQFDMFSSRFFL